MHRRFLIALSLGLAACSLHPGSLTSQAARASSPVESEAAFLFAHGLGDPRGAKYGSAVVDGFPVPRHGWLVGGKLLGWDGVLYPIVAPGPPADVEADVHAFLAPPAPPSRTVQEITRYISRSAATRRKEVERRKRSYLGEDAVLSVGRGSSPRNLVLVLLERAGHPELAEQVRNAWRSSSDSAFQSLATEWINTHYLRAVAAHAAGNDGQAAQWSRTILDALPALREEAARRGVRRGWNPATNKEDLPYFTGGWTDVPSWLQRLAADSQRRLKSPAKPVDLKTLDGIADPKKRIAALIDGLENDRSGSEMYFPQTGDSLLERLAKEGLPAVEPLLACAETDARLTRATTSESHGFALERQPIPVQRVALRLAARILKVYGIGNSAPKLRDYARRFATIPEPLRYRRVLEADDLTGEQWLEAAQALVSYSDARRSLDAKAISALLARRATQPESRERNAGEFAQAATMALCLDAWSPSDAAPLVWKLARLGRKTLQEENREEQDSNCANRILHLCLARLRAGDPEAAPFLEDWLKGAPPEKWSGFDIPKALEGFWLYPDAPGMKDAAERIFAPGSPWSLARLLENEQISVFGFGWDIALLRQPAFRRSAARALADRTNNGEVWRSGESAVFRTNKGGGGRLGNERSADPFSTPENEHRTLRRCDLLASWLATAPGAPSFRPYWTEARKDAAINELKTFLERPWKDRRTLEPLALYRYDSPRFRTER